MRVYTPCNPPLVVWEVFSLFHFVNEICFPTILYSFDISDYTADLESSPTPWAAHFYDSIYFFKQFCLLEELFVILNGSTGGDILPFISL